MGNFLKKSLLASCALILLSCATTRARPVPVTDAAKVRLLPPEAVASGIDGCYLFEGTFGGRSVSSLAYITMNEREVAVTLLSDIGVTLGEIVYDGATCAVESAVIPKRLRAEYIVLDLQNAFAELGPLSRLYGESGLSFAEERTGGSVTRRVLDGGAVVEEITSDGRTVVVRNLLRKYEYRLTAAEGA